MKKKTAYLPPLSLQNVHGNLKATLAYLLRGATGQPRKPYRKLNHL